MKARAFSLVSLTILLIFLLPAVALAGADSQPRADTPTTLVQTVRQATEQFKDVDNAIAAGHGLFLGCVSSPQGGAMGVHFPNGELVGDGALDPMRPEVLVYEPKNGRLELAGVEYLVLYDDWHANNETPPVLMGQVFNYAGSPNRYGMPAFYELHVWAWKHNPSGMFADWNPNVSCEDFVEAASLTGLAPRDSTTAASKPAGLAQPASARSAVKGWPGCPYGYDHNPACQAGPDAARAARKPAGLAQPASAGVELRFSPSYYRDDPKVLEGSRPAPVELRFSPSYYRDDPAVIHGR